MNQQAISTAGGKVTPGGRVPDGSQAAIREPVTVTFSTTKAGEVRFAFGTDMVSGAVLVREPPARAARSLTPDRPLGRNPPDPIV